jgi:hypothetical protein
MGKEEEEKHTMHMIVRERRVERKTKISIVDIYIEQNDAIKVMLRVGCAEWWGV